MTTQGGAQVGNLPCVEKGAPFIWNDPCPSYALDYRGSVWMDFEDVQAAVDASFDTWEQADCGGSGPGLSFTGLRSSTCQRAEYNTSGGNVNTIAFLDPFQDPCRDVAYSAFAFAVTIVWHNTSTGEIFDADMMINDVFATGRAAGGPYANCPDTGCEGTDADLASIVTHEIGHFIGIGHSEVDDATMFASAARTSIEKRTLDPDDIDAVCNIYPPGTLDESCNSAPRGGLELNCETDANGAPIACEDPASQGGCSATRAPADAPWAPLLAVLLGLTVVRRRSGRRDARS
jgi:MYXO-CTERM domain-containing protein